MKAHLEWLDGKTKGASIPLNTGDLIEVEGTQGFFDGERLLWLDAITPGLGSRDKSQGMKHLESRSFQNKYGETSKLRFFMFSEASPVLPASVLDLLCESVTKEFQPTAAMLDLSLEPWLVDLSLEHNFDFISISKIPFSQSPYMQPYPILLDRQTLERLPIVLRGLWGMGRLVLLRAPGGIDSLLRCFHRWEAHQQQTAPGFVFRYFDPRVLRAFDLLMPTGWYWKQFPEVSDLVIEGVAPCTCWKWSSAEAPRKLLLQHQEQAQ